MCIQMEAESRAQSLSPSVYSTISKVLVTRMNEFLLTMPAALIAYLFSPRYRGFLLTSTDGFTKDWEKIITEAWKSVLQYIGVTVDEEMKNRMYRILETYCVNGFSLDSQHPAFRQLNGNTDTSYWDNVRMWCKNSGDKDITPYFVIACIAVRALLAPGTSSRLESAFSIMKLLSNSTRANMSYDRVVSEFIIREAQQQVWGENPDKKRSTRKRSVVSQTFNAVEPDDFVDVFSKESPDSNFDGNDEPNAVMDQLGWFPVPCERILRTHRRRFGNLPGIWNKTYQDVAVSHETATGEPSELTEGQYFC